MENNLLITKAILKETFENRMRSGDAYVSDFVNLTSAVLGGKINQANADEELFNAAMRAKSICSPQMGVRLTGKYGTPYDIPRQFSDGSVMSVREAARAGKFGRDAQASSNTLMPNWNLLWEAVRLDLSIRKAAMPTVREFIYNVLDRPDASRNVNVSEIYPYGVVFEENNGEGQAVPQGETRNGGWDTVQIRIYAAGFTWTLLAALFDNSLDISRLSDAVAIGYNARRDDLAISPILNFAYVPAAITPANAGPGSRQELLYLTLEDAIDDLGVRVDPITGRQIDVSSAIILASELDARHIARVADGLPSTNERKYPGLSEINRVIGYNGETIPLRDRTVTYPGVTAGTAYLIVKNRYMNILVKRGLQVEVDMVPDVKTLSQEERAYWFAEGIHTDGIQWYIQQITLPAW